MVGCLEGESVLATDQLLHRALGDHLSLRENGDAVTDLFDFVEEVARQEHGPVAVAEILDELPDFGHTGRVEAVGRLVEKEQLGIAEQCERDTEPVLHSQ